MKKCSYCAEDIQDDAIVCRYCGRDLLVATTAKTTKPYLDHPWGAVTYTMIGFLFVNLVPVLMLALVFAGMGIEVYVILTVLFLVTVPYFATIGRYGKLSLFGVMNIVVWSVIPFANWWVAEYLGRGLHMKFSRQELHSPPIPTTIGLVIFSITLIVLWVGSASQQSVSPSTPTPRPAFTQRPAVVLFSTPTSTSCYQWNQITPAMNGREVCVYGVVVDYTENWENLLSNFYFGSKEQFFLVSTSRWTDPIEGKCITATGRVQLNTYDVPYIKIEDEIYFCE